MDKRLDRLASLIGADKVESLKNKTVLIAGLGGVGGTCLESLARSGIGSFLLVDFDRVDVTNLNRQILFVEQNIGQLKVEAAAKRLLSISKEIKVKIFASHVDEELLKNLDGEEIDFIIDAIDSPQAKEWLISYAFYREIAFISSLGMANRLDPTAVRLSTLDLTTGDPLAKKMRSLLRKRNIDLANVPVVCSLEKPVLDGPILASVMNVPSAAGLALAHYCLENLLK
ncbi:MAG: tRNA threonylcarbamoyladenosine dehydratase [Bacilli bacterium]|jgi:tRNA A37 threonylcarbamoyladenosine dehydratase